VSADVTKPSPTPADSDALAPIPTPMRLQWRRVRYQVLPAIIFTLSLGATAYLWKNYAGSPHGIGEVSALTIRIAAPHDGKLAKLETYPKVYDHVDANQTVARFDIAHLVTQEEKAQEDLGRLQNDLGDATAEVEKLGKAGGAEAAKLGEAKRRAATLREAVAAGRNRLEDLSKQIQNATIHAPVSGKVTEVLRQPEEFVKQGQEIMTITPDTGAYIVSYVRPESAIRPRKDMRVVIRNQTRRKSAVSIVQAVGTQVQPIPEHQLTNSKKPAWGIPVRIAMPDPTLLPLMPGELVVLNFEMDASK